MGQYIVKNKNLLQNNGSFILQQKLSPTKSLLSNRCHKGCRITENNKIYLNLSPIYNSRVVFHITV